MTSFRTSLALRMALGALLLFFAAGAVSVLSLRSILYRQLDGTLLHLAEVEARAGAATTGPEFAFHEGVLLASRPGPPTELTRYAQLWTREGQPLVRTRNLPADLPSPIRASASARDNLVGWTTQTWRGQRIRTVVYPLRLLGAAHGVHLLQVAAPIEPVERTMTQFGLLVAALAVLGTAGAYLIGWRLAGVALRPTEEITRQAEAIEAGTLSERITAHAEVQEFRRLVTVLNGMLTRLDRAFQVQRRFTADASHELRAPLTVLRGDIEVALKRDRTPEYYRETLHRSREEVLRMSRLAADLLLLARSDAGMPLEHPTELDLLGLAQRVAGRYGAPAAERQQTVMVEGEPTLVLGDEGVLERALGNLVDNAVKYGRPGGTVRIAVRGGREASVTVGDEGPGIPEEHLPHLFTRFFRGDAARTRADSHGLGLAIAEAGARAHGGRLTFLGNAPGATFRMNLPDPPRPSGPPQRRLTSASVPVQGLRRILSFESRVPRLPRERSSHPRSIAAGEERPMRYALITGLILAGGLAGVGDAFAQSEPTPARIRGLRAHQVVEQVLGLRAELALSERQITALTALHTGLARERSGVRNPGPKARHAALRPVTSAREAYGRAAAVLEPAQRATAFGILDRPWPRAAAAAMADPLSHRQ